MSLSGEEGLAGVRVDTGVAAGDSVTRFYDPMIAKLIVHGATRTEALALLNKELADAVVIGPKTNLAFLRALMRTPEVAAGVVDTGFIDDNLVRLGAVPKPPDSRAVAAAARLLLARRDRLRRPSLAPSDPWGVADSFELMGPRRLGLDVLVDGKLERLHLIGSRDCATETDGGAPDDRPETTLFETADGVYVFAGGRQAFVALNDPLERSAGGGDEGDGAVRAPMNGRVAALYVTDGDRVEPGQRLAVVEAMKMEHALTAPFAGRIADVVASLGDQVEMGERIMRVEAGSENDPKTE
jgi:3-methylcrotonyl-CoA carboxylase alpha subunit